MLSSLRQFCAKNVILFSLRKKHCVIHKSITFRQGRFCHFGEGVCLGEGTRLLCWSAYLNGQQQLTPSLTIGSRVHATRNLTIQCANQVTIEDDVLIASDVFIIDFNHGISPLKDSYLENPLDVSEVRIRKGAWIGNNVIILPGVEIGEKSIIGAGSVVTRPIPPYSIAVGNPAVVIKQYDPDTDTWNRVNKEKG